MDLLEAHFAGYSGASTIKERAGVLGSVRYEPHYLSYLVWLASPRNGSPDDRSTNNIFTNPHSNREAMALTRLVVTMQTRDQIIRLR